MKLGHTLMFLRMVLIGLMAFRNKKTKLPLAVIEGQTGLGGGGGGRLP